MNQMIRIILITLCALAVFADPIDDLRMGCNYATALYPYAQKKLSGEDKAQFESFLQFMESGKGAELLPKVLNNAPVAEEEELYLPMVKAFVYCMGKYGTRLPYKDRFAEQLGLCSLEYKKAANTGQAALRKGYLQKPLAETDMQALKDYSILLGITHTGAKILPNHIGLSKPGTGRSKFNFFTPGEPAPDFCLRTLEDALKSPDYSDVRVSDPTAFLKPEAVKALTRLFTDYRPTADGRRVTHEVPEDKEGTFRLSSLRGKKPVLLILADPVDCYHPQVQAMLEPLKRACGDQIEFILVHVSIHDERMSPLEFFGPLKGGSALSLLPENAEQRARTAKLLTMRYPNSTIPCVLDNDSQTTRNDWAAQGGDARVTLIDIDGNVAYDTPASWFYWTKGNYTAEVMEVNKVEREVLKLLANGGKADPERKKSTPDGQKFAPQEPGGPDRDDDNYGYNKNLWFCGKIEAINPETKEATVIRVAPPAAELPGLQFVRQAGETAKLDEQTQLNFQTLEKWINEGAAVRTFKLEDSVELFRNGRVATVAELQPGDIVGVYYDLNEDKKSSIIPELFRVTRIK